jgi:hypothetical protein
MLGCAYLAVAGATISGCARPTLVGKSAPNFTLKDLSGREVSLSDYRGKPVLLAFWAVG